MGAVRKVNPGLPLPHSASLDSALFEYSPPYPQAVEYRGDAFFPLALARVETELENQRYATEMSLFHRLSGLYMMDAERFQEYQRQKQEAAQNSARQIQGIEQNLAQQNKKTWEQLLSPISSAISTSITGMIQGTTTLAKALDNLFQSILASFVNMMVNMAVEWIATQIASATETKAIKTEEAGSVITVNAAEAASGAAASQASIPYVGPYLAVAAAAAMLALVLGYRAMASAEGGWDVDHSAMTMLHPREMVLPASLAEGVRSRIAAGEDRLWKPNNKMFRDIGRAIGDEHGRSIANSIERATRKFRK